MPIEIKELQIRINVDAEPPGDKSSGAGASEPETGGEAMIKAIVDRVLDLLKERAER